MFKENKTEVITLIAFLVVLVLFLNPFGLWMPDTLTYMMVAGIVVIFALFAGLVLKEHARDEREVYNKMVAGRIGYIAGVAVLVFAIALEGILKMNVDTGLVVALGVMVLARFLASLYIDLRG